MRPPIEVHGLVKTFGPVTALDGIDLVIGAGEVHGLLGPNGAGKSTLLRVLFGLVTPDRGQVLLFGREHHPDEPDALEGVAGFVDRPSFWPYLTARRTLRLLADADGLGGREDVDAVLDAVGLTSAADRRVAGWSTGMRQRLGIACALLRRPRLLLLDEPTEGLDPVGTAELGRLVRSLAADGVTVVLSSHDMTEVDALCDRATIVHHGRILRSATLASLRAEAPAGRLRMHTSDDSAAVALAATHPVRIEPAGSGGLSVEASPACLHDFVCALGRRDVSVSLLELEVAPLVALFHALTDTAAPAVPERVAATP